jgi:ATP-binding cassette subfamily F protein 3
LRNEVQQIDARLAALATERTELEARLERGKLPAGELADIGRRLNHGAAEVVVLEERWLALQAELESLRAGS